MNKAERIPCVIMRGGTSKGIFIKANDLPADAVKRDNTILAIFGSPDVRQIDGLAGADPLTSKLAIIGPSSHPGADVDYTFGQVSIDRPVIDYSGNCGNISSAVGPFAIDEGIMAISEPITTVKIHNTNTGKILVAEVPVHNGHAQVTGDCRIAGVPGTGARIMMDFSGTAGSVTGKLLPTGNVVDRIDVGNGTIDCSIVDCANPMVFVRASDMGIVGIESPQEINGNAALLIRLEEIRSKVAAKIKMASSADTAIDESPAFPMIAMVSPPKEYTDFTTGKIINKEDLSLVSRLMFMQVLHKTYAGTGTVCTGAAAKIKGTIVNEMIPKNENSETIKIGHPAGIIKLEARVEDRIVERAAFSRTARRILDGYVYVLEEKVNLN
jgi:methylitaconate Delta-isomerase